MYSNVTTSTRINIFKCTYVHLCLFHSKLPHWFQCVPIYIGLLANNATHLFVILFTGGGICLSACWDTTPRDQAPLGPGTTLPPGADTPWEQIPPGAVPPTRHTPQEDGCHCGRYASYWNAFLF